MTANSTPAKSRAAGRKSPLDTRIATQARRVAKADSDLKEALKGVREARATRDAALTRLEHLIEAE